MSQLEIFYKAMVKYHQLNRSLLLMDGRTAAICKDGRALIHHAKGITQLPIRETSTDIQENWSAIDTVLEDVMVSEIPRVFTSILNDTNMRYILVNNGYVAKLSVSEDDYAMFEILNGPSVFFLYIYGTEELVCMKDSYAEVMAFVSSTSFRLKRELSKEDILEILEGYLNRHSAQEAAIAIYNHFMR